MYLFGFFFVKEYNFLKHLRSMESDGKRNIKQSFQDSCQILYTHRFDRCNYMHNVYVIMQRVCVCKNVEDISQRRI